MQTVNRALDLTTVILLAFAVVLVIVLAVTRSIEGSSLVQLATFVLGGIVGAVTGPTARQLAP